MTLAPKHQTVVDILSNRKDAADFVNSFGVPETQSLLKLVSNVCADIKHEQDAAKANNLAQQISMLDEDVKAALFGQLGIKAPKGRKTVAVSTEPKQDKRYVVSFGDKFEVVTTKANGRLTNVMACKQWAKETDTDTKELVKVQIALDADVQDGIVTKEVRDSLIQQFKDGVN